MSKVEAFQMANQINRASARAGISLNTVTMAHPVMVNTRIGWEVSIPLHVRER